MRTVASKKSSSTPVTWYFCRTASGGHVKIGRETQNVCHRIGWTQQCQSCISTIVCRPSQYIIVPVCFTVFNHEVNCCQLCNVMRHWNCSFSIMASAGGHRVWKRSESSLNVSMWVSVWLVVKLPTQKLQWGDGLMPATHRTQSALSLTSTYVTSKAESGMNTDNFNCKRRWGSAEPTRGSRQPCSTRAILWESWRGASSAVGELWEMFTLQKKKKKQGGPVI